MPVPTPLPWQQFIPLCLCMFVNSVCLTFLFPLLYFVVKDMASLNDYEVDDKDVGFQAGYIASSMFLGMGLGSAYWGMKADEIGRKPILILGLCVMSIATLAFGFSSSIAWACVCRFLSGLLNVIFYRLYKLNRIRL